MPAVVTRITCTESPCTPMARMFAARVTPSSRMMVRAGEKPRASRRWWRWSLPGLEMGFLRLIRRRRITTTVSSRGRNRKSTVGNNENAVVTLSPPRMLEAASTKPKK